MAILNPSPPTTQDPNWDNQSRVVEAPRPIPVIENKSVGQALTSLGSGLDSAVGLVDTAIKKGIEKEAYHSVDPIRDSFTAGLEQLKSQLNQGQIPTQGPAGSVTTKSLLDANDSADETPEAPPVVSGGMDRITQLAQAKAAGSPKLNDTQYAGAVLAEAKRIRAQVPEGYRAYVDQEISKASGLPVANSYYQNMVQDINHQLTLLGKNKDDIKTMMERNADVPGMGQLYKQYLSGDKSITQPFIFGKIADWQTLQAQLKIDAATRASSDYNRANSERLTTGQLSSSLDRTYDYFAGNKISLNSMAGLGDTMHWLNEDMAGGHPDTPDHDQVVKQRVYQLQAYRQGIYEMMKNDSRGHAQVIGDKATEDMINNKLTPLDNLIKLANDPVSSPARYHQQMIEAIKQDDTFNWLASKDKGAISRQFMAGKQIFGDQYFPDWFKQWVSTPGPDGKPLDQPVQDAFKQEALSAVTPPVDKRGQPIPRYLKDAVQHGKEVDVGQLPSFVGKAVQLVSSITDPKMPMNAKDKLIDWAFNPEHNHGLMDELKMDYRDPNTGEMVPGKYRALNLMTSPAVTNAVRESAMTHPENYGKYRDLIEQEFGGVYKQTIQDMNKLSGLGIHFSWSDNNVVGLVDNKNRPITRDPQKAVVSYTNPTDRYVQAALDKVDLLNKGISNLSVMHRNDPRGGQEPDTAKYLFRTLNTMRFSGELTPDSNKSVVEMQRAMIKARQPEITQEDLNKLMLRNE